MTRVLTTFQGVERRTTPLLDLKPSLGQRYATFRFDRVDGATGQELGELHPVRDNPPTLTHDTNRTIKRTLSPLVLPEDEAAQVDPINNRVRVSMLLGTTSYPLGRYVFIDHTLVRTTAGTRSTSALVDEMLVVDQKIERAFSSLTREIDSITTTGEVVESAIQRLLEGLPITFSVEPTPYGSIGSWPQGTNRGRILDDLALEGGYFSPWFDNGGELRVIRAFDPADVEPDFDWDAQDVVLRDSITETSDLISAPNRIVVVSNTPGALGTSSQPVVGSYNVPSSAPHSLLNRGFLVTDVRELQLISSSQASQVAFNLGQRENVFERTELSTPPDPRHDSYDVVRWRGDSWLELGWTLPLIEGAEMRHVLRKAYR